MTVSNSLMYYIEEYSGFNFLMGQRMDDPEDSCRSDLSD